MIMMILAELLYEVLPWRGMVRRVLYTCLGSIDVQERSWLFKGLFSLVDVSLKIRKEGFY